MTLEISSAGTGAIGSDDRGRKGDWIRLAADAVEFERMEAFFSGPAYENHRHDTYAIGRTLSGVQSFHYRGAARNSLPGKTTIVLHPDEMHDGQSGAEGGFRYRMVYIHPAEIQGVLGGRPLPFIKDGISTDPRLRAAVSALLPDMHHRIELLEYEDAVYDLARALDAASMQEHRDPRRIIDYRSAERARDYIEAEPSGPISLQHLERISGRDRWSLSRDFRQLYGTSPHRYLVMRRLAAVRTSLRAGIAPAQAALDAGFVDQSHMIRHFTRTFGVSPSRWLRMLRS
ncbi:MAG: AraC family transcriptional regulator [Alphaproteobacteria bacterium]